MLPAALRRGIGDWVHGRRVLVRKSGLSTPPRGV